MSTLLQIMQKFNKEHVSIFNFLILNGILIDWESLNPCHLKEMKILLKIIQTEQQSVKMMKTMSFQKEHFKKLPLLLLSNELLLLSQLLMTYSDFQGTLYQLLRPKHLSSLNKLTIHLTIYLVLHLYKLLNLFKINRSRCQIHQMTFLGQVLLSKPQFLRCSLFQFIQFIIHLLQIFMHNSLNQIQWTLSLEVEWEWAQKKPQLLLMKMAKSKQILS